MTELYAIVDRYRAEREKGTRVLHLATLLATEGSTYRRPGARTLFVTDDSPRGYATIGLVSGGCVEGDLALRRTNEGPRAELHAYDLDADGDVLFGLGLGCKGKLWICLERIEVGSPDDILAQMEGWLARAGGPGFLVHSLDTESQGTPSWAPSLEEALVGARATTARRAFVEVLAARTRLALFGAGPDVVPQIEIARTLGWHVAATDHRPALLAELADLGAETQVCPIASLAKAADGAAAEAVVVMTHQLEADVEVLRGLAAQLARGSSIVRYVGLLGPSRRRDDALASLTSDERDALAGVLHGPCGLDLGGDGPAAVALAVTAEIQATLHRRSGVALRTKRTAIHDDHERPLLAVVLAGGESRRFGGPKALAELGGKTLLAHAVDALRATAGVTDVVAVVGARADTVGRAASDLGARIVVNEEWERGMTSSLRVAAREAHERGARGLLVVTVDQPSLTSAHLASMISAFDRGHSIVGSYYDDTLGIPALFGAPHFDEIMTLADDERGKDLLARHHESLARVPLARGGLDVDTRADLLAYDPVREGGGARPSFIGKPNERRKA